MSLSVGHQDGLVIAIYVDCNALWRNVSLSNDLGKRLRKHLANGSAELRISPVVLAELRRRADDELQSARSEAIAAIERATRATNTDTASLVSEQEALFEKIASGIKDQFDELQALDGVVVDDWPQESARKMGERELQRRRPFLERSVGTIGHRDALIWVGLVEGLESLYEEDDFAIFVSKDEGFRAPNGKGLHSDLQQDVDGVYDRRFELVPSLFDALTILDLHEESITRREANIRTAMSMFVEQLENESWDWEHTELPPDFESARVLDAEYLGGEVIGDGNPVICTFRARVQIEGAMLKDQWYLDTDSEVQLWDGEINDHYMSVYVERIVEFQVEIDVDETGEVVDTYATNVQLA